MFMRLGMDLMHYDERLIKASAYAVELGLVTPESRETREVQWMEPELRTWKGFSRFCVEQLRIVDQRKQIVALQLNWLQRHIWARELRARRAGRRPWFIILKYRRGGVTTLQQALNYWQIWRQEHQECATFAHRQDDTRKIFRMVDRFYQNQPVSQRHPKTPAKTLWIEFPTWDGFYSAQTAGSAGAGRGLGMSRLHLSEAAFYSDLEGLHTGLHDTIAEVEGSAYVIESTPNGRVGKGEDFYEFYQTAKRGESEFIPIFVAWHMDPANQRPLLAPDELGKLSDEEQQLQVKHALSLEQVKWWREKRRGLLAKGGRSDIIHQEHPSDDETCFLMSIAGYYDRDLIAALEPKTREPLAVEENGRLRIYEWPKDDVSYSLGGDIAEGVGADDSTCYVINCSTGATAAVWQSNQIPPDEYGRMVIGDRISGLGWRYQNTSTEAPAFVTLERNNHGHAALAGLLKMAEYPRDRVYHHVDPTMRTREGMEKQPEMEKKAGWPHTQVSHVQLTNVLGRVIREGEPEVADAPTLVSIREVGIGPSGAEFTSRDLAVGLGLAVIGLPYATDKPRWAWIGGERVEL